MLTGNGLVSWTNNSPVQYKDKQRQYFSPETRTFTQLMAQYSSDFVEGQVQGLDVEHPYKWQTRRFRMSELVRPTAAIQRDFDDYKTVLFADRDIEYIMQGAKIVAMGSTWLVVNPLNLSGGDGAAVVRRCNSVWNFLDFYGNVVSEPILVENTRANANDADAQQSLMINKGYFNVICQYNENTAQIDTNTRMVLGTAAYRVTGYSDFDMEFTGDYPSVRTLSFSVRYEETNDAIDDLVNHVAGGKTFSWNITVNAPDKLRAGVTVQASATSARNGENVPQSEENPVSYLWSSSDETVLTVDATGIVTAVGEGDAEITATLEQNPSHSASMQVTVTQSEDGVAFMSTIPQIIGAFEQATISAAYFIDGEEQPDALEWEFSGASDTAYAYTIEDSGKKATVFGYAYSVNPLIVTVKYGQYSESAVIGLGGI